MFFKIKVARLELFFVKKMGQDLGFSRLVKKNQGIICHTQINPLEFCTEKELHHLYVI